MKVLGIDIGGTGIKGAIVDTKRGKLVTDRVRIPTPDPATPQAVIDTVIKLVKEFDYKGPIGCGFPAAVRHEIVKTASNIDKSWLGMNAAAQIRKATKCPTHLINDVDAAGIAEMKFGAGKKQKRSDTTLVVAAGTGIGTALFIGKNLVPNTELGFVQVKGMPGEHYAANSVRESEELSMKDWATRFNEYLVRLESLFWPDLFIMGGGISKKFEEYEKYFTLDTKIVPAKSRNHAGIIGAALSAKDLID
ncbi:MAG: polyphosphate glucokinase [Flammeovirgaceae bacterium]|nr:polyphosphate glucokinase [Flammeovirgaceae bacterium]MBR08569.1 polyphosphate glucokinase [Rickettsiales bacterium]HCX22309.1 polyphosphate glucokinase [Cytophagales bacterium]|tara:strand:+ start:991 stop:1737 length:747 start_codon:yes stop_codon:yes gene_type:complete